MTNSWTKSRSRTARWTVPTAVATLAALAMAGAAVPATAAPVAALSPSSSPVSSTVSVVAPGHGQVDPDALRRALAGLPDAYVRGAMVSVTGRDGRWSGTAGEWRGPVEEDFAIGSVTKLFTSAVVLQLVGEGRLSLDDTVQEVLPDLLPEGYEPITLAQLLSHTSGLQQPSCVRPGTPVEVVKSAVSCGTPTSPGATVQYNGINYFIAGLVIEKVTGRPYAEELDRRVVRPLGLRHTRLPADDWAWAEGGLVSNAGDLRRFATALMGGGLLRPAERKLLFTTPPLSDARFSYGGLMTVRLDNGVVVWGKTGTNHGYTSGVFATPGLDRVVVYSTLPTGKDVDEEVKRVKGIAEAAFTGA
jgi:D-alanyl-D-alanine carboxypeptidase